MKFILTFAILTSIAATTAVVVFRDGAAPQIAAAEDRADQVLIDKSRHRLTLFRDDEVLARYSFAAFAHPARAECASNGVYRVRQRNPKRLYRLSLGLGPAKGAARRFALIHGRPRVPEAALALVSSRSRGCIGVTNAQMRDIWSRVSIGTEVIIR